MAYHLASLRMIRPGDPTSFYTGVVIYASKAFCLGLCVAVCPSGQYEGQSLPSLFGCADKKWKKRANHICYTRTHFSLYWDQSRRVLQLIEQSSHITINRGTMHE